MWDFSLVLDGVELVLVIFVVYYIEFVFFIQG